MPTVSQLSRFMSTTKPLAFAAACPMYAFPEEKEPKVLRFADFPRIVKEVDAERHAEVLAEYNDMVDEENFDEAAVPAWQMI